MTDDPPPTPSAMSRLGALVAATSDVVYRMSADWAEMQPLDGRGLVVDNQAPMRGWMERNLPADEHARVREAIAGAIANKRLFELEHRVVMPDGSEGWTQSRAVPVLDAAGEIIEWVGLARDITSARRAQDALRDGEQRFRAVFEQATGGIAQVDLDARFVLVNERFCEIVGRPRDEVLSLRIQDLTHPDDLAASVAAFGEVARGRQPEFTIEKRYLRPDGSTVWVHNAVSAIRDPDGGVRYITAMVSDITALREAREAQAALAAQRQLALDAARLGWWQFDPATGLVTHDARYAEIYGLDDSSPQTSELIASLLHPEDVARVWDAVRAALDPADPAPYAIEYRVNRRDGTTRWLEARGLAHFEGEGPARKASNFVGTVADVTERRGAEEQMRVNEARFRIMADASPATLWLTDPEGECTFLSRQWYEHTGQTEEEALGLGWTEATHPDDKAEAGQAFVEANAARTLFRTEYRLRAADGSYRWAIDIGRPWYDERGEYAGMVGAVFDIDDRKRAEEGLEEASRRKDEFLATLAHELRNPLAPVTNALQVWPQIEDRPDQVARLREMMGRQMKQMVRLIDDLLDVSRITRGRIELRKSRIDLSDVVAAALEASQPFIEARRHTLQVALPPVALLVDADEGRLVQVLGNLLHNAAKYTPPGGHLWLRLSVEGDTAVVSVRDDGCGIPPAMREAVFDMFAQVDQSLGRAHGGLGIGLTLVRKLVELHGGTVQAYSEGEGQGSELVVRLPVAAVGGRPDAAPAPPAAPDLPPRRVLVVDDVASSADTLALMLAGLGQDARAAYDGPAALEVLDALRPQVAFIDIAMPGMDGYQLAAAIRARPGPAPTLVALTGYGQLEDRARALAGGFDAHLVKPTSIEQLAAVLSAPPQATAQAS